MTEKLNNILKDKIIRASAPCRLDLGGTLDIKTFFYPLALFKPCTFNIALDLRTTVSIAPYTKGRVKISSRGFESAEFAFDQMPFQHPLGLMFAVAAFYQADGVHIIIESTSPPRSALGGSSAAAVALVAAFEKALKSPFEPAISDRKKIALTAHALEESVAGVPCGLQDQLAAAFGGVNAWFWQARQDAQIYRKKVVVKKKNHSKLAKHILLAYCGNPHESKNINSQWVRLFLKGKCRKDWVKIIHYTHEFIKALQVFDINRAVILMNQETAIRRQLTPDVLDDIGVKLVESAGQNGCGARFCGAGGGGCIWALCPDEKISKLKSNWQEIIATRENAALMEVIIADSGVC